MNTFLSETQERNKETYEAFARDEVAPRADSLDNRSLPLRDFLSEIGQRGYLGLTVPQEYGGKGLQFLEAVFLAEAVSKQEPGLGFTFAAHTAVIELIVRFGTDVQKSRYLPLLARGDTLGTVAITEANAGTDALAAETTALPAGDKFVLNGKKTWVVNGDVAGLLLVLAKDADQTPHLFLLEAGTKGVAVTANRIKMGLRSASANDMQLSNVELNSDALLGTAGDAIEQVAFAADIAKVLIAASAVGLTTGALDIAADHSRTRQQFGVPISSFQAIQWRLADMSAESAAAQMLTYRAAWSKDENPPEFRRNAAMCKWFATKVARVHSGEAVQVLGSFGLDEDCKTERFYRDAKTMEIAGGTSELQKILLVAELDI